MAADYKRDFVEFAVSAGVLKFGQFTLKSGRISPYFFNAGLFSSGQALSQLGSFYAAAIKDAVQKAAIKYDVLFGPAYKGIPLVSATSIALHRDHSQNVPYSFNRKEAKDHGEGGNIVGASLKDQRVLIVDDVITAGTAIRESINIIRTAGGEAVGVLIALDRQERGIGTSSAVEEVEKEFGIPVISVVSLADIISHVQSFGTVTPDTLQAIQTYRQEYGIQT